MSTPKFTPGPWYMEHYGAGYLITNKLKLNTAGHAFVEDLGKHRTEERDANASLIVAAPELYEALKEARDAMLSLECPLTIIEREIYAKKFSAVLAKAEDSK